MPEMLWLCQQLCFLSPDLPEIHLRRMNQLGHFNGQVGLAEESLTAVAVKSSS